MYDIAEEGPREVWNGWLRVDRLKGPLEGAVTRELVRYIKISLVEAASLRRDRLKLRKHETFTRTSGEGTTDYDNLPVKEQTTKEVQVQLSWKITNTIHNPRPDPFNLLYVIIKPAKMVKKRPRQSIA